jgi:hypothetical protein
VNGIRCKEVWGRIVPAGLEAMDRESVTEAALPGAFFRLLERVAGCVASGVGLGWGLRPVVKIFISNSFSIIDSSSVT